MSNQPSFIPLELEKADEIKRLCPTGASESWFRVIPQEKIPTVFPESFREKLDHAVVMASGDAGGKVYLVINAHRVDMKSSALDQEPFGIVLDNGVPSESGVFIHHGGWLGRTEHRVPPEFWEHVAKSGVGNYYPPPSLPPDSAGSLCELEKTSNLDAFNQTLKTILESFELHDQPNER